MRDMPPPLAAVVSGSALGLSLIVAIGAQNAFVLRQGLRGAHVAMVVTVCTLSDVVLIYAGALGAAAAVTGFPAALTVLRYAGAAFLIGYGLLAVRRALRPGILTTGRATGGTAAAAASTALALTWLNPHVYLDTLVLLGSLSSTWGELRWWFAGGAAVASAVWFTALGFGAELLRPVFARPAAWRVLDVTIALIMFTLTATLLAGGLDPDR